MTELDKMLEKIEATEGFGEEAGKLLRAEITKRNNEARDNKNDMKEFVNLLKESLGVESKDEVQTKVTEFATKEEQLMNDLTVMKKELQKGLDEIATEKEAKTKAEKDKKYLENMTAIKDLLAEKKIKKDDYFIKGLMGDIKESTENGLLVGEEKLGDFLQRTEIDEVLTITDKKDKKETKTDNDFISREDANKMGYAEYKAKKEAIDKSKASW